MQVQSTCKEDQRETVLQHAGRKGSEDALQAAMDKFEAAGGYDADKRIANVLTGLGFKQEEWNKSCSEFSGGWQVTPGTIIVSVHATQSLSWGAVTS